MEFKGMFFHSFIIRLFLFVLISGHRKFLKKIVSHIILVSTHAMICCPLHRYVQEWLNCMVAAGIVTVHAGDRFELPYDEQALRTHGHGATILPILSNMIPKLEQVLPKDGPRGEERK